MKDNTGGSRGFGFVSFETHDAAAVVSYLALIVLIIMSCNVSVHYHCCALPILIPWIVYHKVAKFICQCTHTHHYLIELSTFGYK